VLGADSRQLPPGDVETFRVKTDNIPQAEIAGWGLRAPGKANGTLFMCHGFHNSKKSFNWYGWIATREHWNVVAFDFREHGESTHGLTTLPTLGYYEIWDLKAVVDWAEKQGLEKPYACYGVSMGAATALRWAGMDDRIVGVLAQSPFKNALRGAEQFQKAIANHPLAKLAPLLVTEGLEQMWKQVEIPDAVAKRADLLLWLTVGDHDFFPVEDQEDILAASRSPRAFKRLFIRENSSHGGAWAWKDNDRTIVNFLRECERRPVTSFDRNLRLFEAGGLTAGLPLIGWRYAHQYWPKVKVALQSKLPGVLARHDADGELSNLN
jgi:pimeloyl-ACP methyl ester carboxylesterase